MPILECSPLHLWGSELRAWRDRRGLSLAELGARIFYNASHLGKFERGERIPPRHVAEACDRALDADGHLLRLWLQIDQDANPARHAHGDEAKSKKMRPNPPTRWQFRTKARHPQMAKTV